MRDQRAKFLAYLFGPFFRWWWALLTGAATLLSYQLTPEPGWHLSSTGALLITLLCFTLLFLTGSVVHQGWRLFRGKYADLVLRAIQKNKDLGADYVFIVTGDAELPIGTVIDVHRRSGEVEVPFALIEIIGTTSDGHYQALPRWLSPLGVRDLNSGKLTTKEAVLVRNITSNRIREISAAI